MELSLKKVFAWSWRLALVSLPWQTHLIIPINDSVPAWRAAWNGAIYVSWIPIIITILLGLAIPTVIPAKLALDSDRGGIRISPFTYFRRIIFWFTLAILFLGSSFSQFPEGTFQWWIQIVLLFLFASTLIKAKIEAKQLVTWISIGLIPQALLAVQQALTQSVIASKWLGIAAQLPETRGVAVVEANGLRLLRAYGGMPYPNILGGWLAFGLPGVVWLASLEKDYRCWLWTIVGALFALALILTHSRSAWLAFLIFLISLVVLYPKAIVPWIKKHWLMVVPIALAFLIGSLWQLDALRTRVTVEGRLEERSVSERLDGYAAGWDVFKTYPVFGLGRNAFGWVYDVYALPHNVGLISLAETGLVGTLGAIVFFGLLITAAPNRRKFLLLLFPLLIISALDHYPWSYWSGQTLVMLVFCFLFLSAEDDRRVLT